MPRITKATSQMTNNTTTSQTTSRSRKRLLPSITGGLDIGREFPLSRLIDDQKARFFRNAERNQKARVFSSGYDRDWGDAIIDQQLADDPSPINGGLFHPVKRWIVVYRTAEAGVDGSHTITVREIREAIGSGTANPNPFIINKLHIWIAPHDVNTHFSGLLITKDDEDNGILGGQYSDIAPYGEFVKFRVTFRGEGYVTGASASATKEVITLGGSAKWNAVVYAQVQTYD